MLGHVNTYTHWHKHYGPSLTDISESLHIDNNSMRPTTSVKYPIIQCRKTLNMHVKQSGCLSDDSHHWSLRERVRVSV